MTNDPDIENDIDDDEAVIAARAFVAMRAAYIKSLEAQGKDPHARLILRLDFYDGEQRVYRRIVDSHDPDTPLPSEDLLR